MNRREFLMSTLAVFALSALPKLTLAEKIAVSESVKAQINPTNKAKNTLLASFYAIKVFLFFIKF